MKSNTGESLLSFSGYVLCISECCRRSWTHYKGIVLRQSSVCTAQGWTSEGWGINAIHTWHVCYGSSLLSCTSSHVLVPPMGRILSVGWDCCSAGSSSAASSPSAQQQPQHSPLWSHSPQKNQIFTDQKHFKGKKKKYPEITKRFNVPTVLLNLLSYVSCSTEQLQGKKNIAREFPISSASLLGFHFRKGRNLKWS